MPTIETYLGIIAIERETAAERRAAVARAETRRDKIRSILHDPRAVIWLKLRPKLNEDLIGKAVEEFAQLATLKRSALERRISIFGTPIPFLSRTLNRS